MTNGWSWTHAALQAQCHVSLLQVSRLMWSPVEQLSAGERLQQLLLVVSTGCVGVLVLTSPAVKKSISGLMQVSSLSWAPPL
jgi:hypothetical protein